MSTCGRDGLAGGVRRAARPHRELLEELGGEYHEIVGADIAEALIDFARAENAPSWSSARAAARGWRS